MTTDEAISRRDEETFPNGWRRLGTVPTTTWVLLGILAVAIAVHGWRALLPFYVRGDLLYHWGLTNTILLGTFPPEGPYLGLPAYYPPGFHLVLAAIASIPGLDLSGATMLLGLLWLPVIPLGAYVLARRLTGRTDVALVAAALTAFAGGLDVSNDRLWVNSLSMIGQVAYPIYPRDLVFGLLPFAILAFLRALDGGNRWPAWAGVAGVLFGVCGLLQIQLLLPIPSALATFVVVIAARNRSSWRAAATSIAVTGLIAIAIVGPWLSYLAQTIARNGGVSIESSEELLPLQIGFWNYPIQFGIVLPLTIIGAGIVLLRLRRSEGYRRIPGSDRSNRYPAEGGVLVLAWWIVPFVLAVTYQSSWPLEDALRPQRMWLVASQPGLILAAIGLVALVDRVVDRHSSAALRAGWAVPLIVGAILVASVPASVATTRLMTILWTQPQYAHLEFARDRVPDFGRLLNVHGPRPTVLTYEDWSSLVWYSTGAAVVAVEPPGYAKLAFDPERYTGTSQTERRLDLAGAFAGDVRSVIAAADRYGANQVVLARREGSIGLISQPATIAASLGSLDGPAEITEGNGWDALILEPGSSLTLAIDDVGSRIDLELRMGTAGVVSPDGIRTDGRVRVHVGNAAPVDVTVPASGGADLSVVTISVDRAAGAPVVIEAIDRVIIQALTGFVPDPGPPVGWTVATETPDAVVWRRSP